MSGQQSPDPPETPAQGPHNSSPLPPFRPLLAGDISSPSTDRASETPPIESAPCVFVIDEIIHRPRPPGLPGGSEFYLYCCHIFRLSSADTIRPLPANKFHIKQLSSESRGPPFATAQGRTRSGPEIAGSMRTRRRPGPSDRCRRPCLEEGKTSRRSQKRK